jgi:hypothetical protein
MFLQRSTPKGKVLISVSFNGIPTVDDILWLKIRRELKQWYGEK